jgi:phosphoglucosamine mutase
MIRYPQVVRNLPRNGRGLLPETLKNAVEQVNSRLGAEARVLVRPSGTEPLVRVLAEAPTQAEAEDLCATVAALVSKELG